MKDFKKIIHPGDVLIGERHAKVFCIIEYKDERLSVSGVIGPNKYGNARGGCGQIDMGFFHAVPKHNDKRYEHPDRMGRFAKGWSEGLWFVFLEVWHEWHLNDMKSGCWHQNLLGWDYEHHHDEDEFEGDACPVCGYKIGSAWNTVPVPEHVLEFLKNLPDSDTVPAWC